MLSSVDNLHVVRPSHGRVLYYRTHIYAGLAHGSQVPLRARKGHCG
jgi:hypothetical protein